MKPSDVHNTIGQYMLQDGDPIVVDLENSHGPYLKDLITGKEFIDFFTYFASIPVGYNHPKMKEQGFLDELLAASISKPSSSDFYTEPMAKFVDTFGRVAMPNSMKHLFLISGGGLAVENSLKAAFDWKVRKNIGKLNSEGAADEMLLDGFGSKIIHFKEAFHGRTGYTMSLTNTDDPRKYMYFPKFDWPRIINPKMSFPETEEGIAEVIKLEEMAISQIEIACQQYKGDIAAIIIETIQGEGGDNHFRPEFFQVIRNLADKHEFLFIVDEVQSGMGITGKMWAIEHYGVEPDIICFGKKSQVCGIIAGPRIEEVKNNVFEESSRINSTWGGSLADMVRATRYLEIMEEDNLLAHTTKVGGVLISGLQSIAEESKGMISNVRGKGMMVAMDLPSQNSRNEMVSLMLNKGVKTFYSGNKSIRFRGMLDMPESVIHKALEIVATSIPVNK
jgi:L-lysine 6-transaminase